MPLVLDRVCYRVICLAIIVLKPRAVQSIIIGLIARRSRLKLPHLPGADLVARPIVALVMFAFVFEHVCKKQDHAFVSSFVTTAVSVLFLPPLQFRKTCRL